MNTLRLILGDQLNKKHSWYKCVDKEVTFAMFEVQEELTYTKHHIQKVVGFFAAMRAFAACLEAEGHRVVYYRIGDLRNKQSITMNLQQLFDTESFDRFEYQEPDEWRVEQYLQEWSADLNMEVKAVGTEHFLTTRSELSHFFEGKKQFLMENFYRYMRKKHSILMTGKQPEGGKWNYDKNNRKKWKQQTLIPIQFEAVTDVSALLEELEQSGALFFGKVDPNRFTYPVNRSDAMAQLHYFIDHLLVFFGDYQDAMHDQELVLYHSKISFALNIKLIDPLEVLQEVERAYRENDAVSIEQAEGFIRQILGWREYMRGMYWLQMPAMESSNYFEHRNSLPTAYWTGKTRMNCLKHCVNNSLDTAYAHHIQRLMVLGNIALLLQVAPQEVDDWFLGIYIDAVQWVQLPNTRGMSQFADGGNIATKPYISSANYVDKMSNYCQGCSYDKKTKIEENSCPLNSLYWDFLITHDKKLRANRRMSMMYRLLDKMDSEQRQKISARASYLRAHTAEI